MQKIRFPVFNDSNGALAVFEGGGVGAVPFAIARVFTVVANNRATRGNHAHYRCTQLLVCLSGKIRVTCFDGQSTEVFLLENAGEGVLVSPGTWATQEYQEDDSVMMVLCDRGYEADDYMRDYQTFVDYKLGST